MQFKPGDKVVKNKGDYRYEGTIVSVFEKLSGDIRYVVEHDDLGILFIFNEQQIELRDGTAEAA